MSNWFAGIGQAASGLNAARYGLSVVSQNISNADTDGYTRETSIQGSVELGATGIWARTTDNTMLGGVKVLSTQRADDPVLDARARDEHARGASADTTASIMTNVESLFPEPSDNGLASQLNDFWAAWGNVANDPGNTSTRTVLLQKASGLVTTLHSTSASLSDVATSTSGSLTTDIASANTAASQLATLNAQIRTATSSGADANSLLDQRDQVLDTLSKLVGGSATINADGTATVTVGGTDLVNGATANTLSVDSSYQVSINGSAVSVSSGSVSAETTMLTTTLPQYQSQLDAVADALSSTVNAIQTSGYDQNGTAGVALFSGSGAAGITLATTDPSKIAAASVSGVSKDGSNALNASEQGTAANGPDAAYAALVGGVATATQSAQQASALQDSVVSNVNSLKSSVSGVNYDEEVTNMLTYQRAFQASSRVLTTLDDMLDTLINHTGHVGIA